MSIHEDWKEEPAAGQPKPSSGCRKVLLILLALGGTSALICCGGGAFIFWKIRKASSTEPAVVRQRTEQIATIDIPAEFEPAMSMDFAPVVQMQFVVYQTPKKDGMLVIATGPKRFVHSDEDPDLQMKDLLIKQGMASPDFEVIHSDKREFQIRGKPVEFQFAEVKDKEENLYHNVVGEFEGKSGLAILFLYVRAEDYDEDAIDAMIESIK